MPSINKNQEQEIACKEISDLLNEVKILNHQILAGTDANIRIIVGEKTKEYTLLEDYYKDKIMTVLKGSRARRIKEITTKMSKYGISLSAKEQQIISDYALSAEQEPDTENLEDLSESF